MESLGAALAGPSSLQSCARPANALQVEMQVGRPQHSADFLAPDTANNWILPHTRHIHKESGEKGCKDFAVKQFHQH